jgi:hypothetical protein
MTKRNPPWTPGPRHFIWVSLAFLAVVAVYWAVQPGAPQRTSKPSVPQLTASVLFDRYRENETATQLLFGNDRIAVTGKVLGVDAREKELLVAFQHDRGDLIAATAFMHRMSWSRASRLKPGMRVTVECDRANWLGGGPALLIGCEF